MDTNSTKKFSWKAAILLFFIVGLLTAGLSVFVQARNRTISPNSAAALVDVPRPIPAYVAAVSLGSSFEVPGKPVRLVIPAIDVDAAVQSVGLAWASQNKGDIGTPSNFTDVAWYNGGPLPGMPGSAVIAKNAIAVQAHRGLEKLKLLYR